MLYTDIAAPAKTYCFSPLSGMPLGHKSFLPASLLTRGDIVAEGDRLFSPCLVAIKYGPIKTTCWP